MKFRLDLGRIFPGLLLLISGLIILVVLAFVAAITYVFSFLAGAGSFLGVVLELMLVPTILMAAGAILIVSGVSWWGKGGAGWFSGIVRSRALQDRIRLSGRVGEIIGIIISSVVFLFLYENQLREVPFFTSDFGLTAAFFFYTPLFTGMALSLARGVYGRRNAIRPFDSLNELFLAISAFWLLAAFPFDFTHLGDMFPASIQFILGWLTNDIGRILITLTGLGALLSFAITAIMYSSVRSQLLGMQQRSF